MGNLQRAIRPRIKLQHLGTISQRARCCLRIPAALAGSFLFATLGGPVALAQVLGGNGQTGIDGTGNPGVNNTVGGGGGAGGTTTLPVGALPNPNTAPIIGGAGGGSSSNTGGTVFNNGGTGGGGAGIGAPGGGGTGGSATKAAGGGGGGGGGAGVGNAGVGGAGGVGGPVGNVGGGVSVSVPTALGTLNFTNNSSINGGFTPAGNHGGGAGGSGAGIGGGGGGGGAFGTGAGFTGGAGGAVTAAGTITNTGTIMGGQAGSASTVTGGGGGGGGAAGIGGGGGAGGGDASSAAAGGLGAAGGDATTATTITIANFGAIAGGAGGGGASGSGGGGGGDGIGDGGSGGAGFASSGTAGSGGAGGMGFRNAIIFNAGTIAGGQGGSATVNGAGGVGVRGSNLTVTNAGTIAGGLAGDRVTQANAITFTGGINSLELQAGWAITGKAVGATGAGTSNSLILGGDTTRTSGTGATSFNVSNLGTQYQNFTNFQKSGASIWTLTGSGSQAWTVTGGSLQADATSLQGSVTFIPAIGSTAGVIFDQGSGNPNSTVNGTYSGVISGNGSVTKVGAGTLVLSGTNTYHGGTSVGNGTLQLGASGALPVGTAVTLGAGTTSGILDLNGFSPTVGGLATAGTGTANVIGSSSTSANSTLTFAGTGAPSTFGGTIQNTLGSGTKTVALAVSSGTLVLTGTNTYSGGTDLNAGTLVVGNNSALGTGTLAMAAGTTLSWLAGANYTVGNNISLTGDPNFAPAAGTVQTLTGVILDGSSPGVLDLLGPGALVLTGPNSYTGGTIVSAGSLFINGDQTAATGATTVANGAKLGGTGTIGGSVSVANGGTLAPGGVGGGVGTLTINGNLALSSGSILNYSFGQAGTAGGTSNDLTAVKGNLTLAGTLNVNVAPGGSFGPGVYRVISYGGTLTDNGLALGVVPPGTTDIVQTSVAHQVNLVNSTGVTLNFWDGGAAANKNNGIVDGGSGIWNTGAGANDNWATAVALVNAPWTNGGFAIFQATPGTVTVDDSLGQVAASGMQFATSGYVVNGGPLTLVETAPGSGATTIRVGDGTLAGSGYTATIASVLQGSTQLVKTDLGTLVLGGANTYSGGTAINGGTLQVSADDNLGAATGGLSFDGGTLATTASFASARTTTLNSGGGTFDVAPGTTLTLSGAIGGVGALAKADTGTLVLTGNNTYAGGTVISAGTLQLGDGGTSGSIVGDVTDNGTLAFDRSDTVTFSGVISGFGALAQIGSGTTILTADSPYTGGTSVDAGTLVVGDPAHPSAALSGGGPITVAGGATLGGYGSVTGNVLNGGTVAAGNATPGFGASPAGTFTITGNLLNEGLVNLASDPIIGNVLEVRGNYVGVGGRMTVNTFLGSDGSPSDKLVINGGTATGTTSVRVINAGGPGAETRANGILLVQAINGATTAPGAFALAFGELRAGDADYDLFRGSVDASAPSDWFLRSDFVVGPPIPGPVPPGPLPPEPILPPDAPPEILPPGTYPIIGPELATYGVVQPLARQLGLATLGTLNDRLGDSYADGNAPCAAASPPASRQATGTPATSGTGCGFGGLSSAWARLFGQSFENHYRAFADPRADGQLAGFQAGLDLLHGSYLAGQYERAGLYVAYGNLDADAKGLVTNPAATGYELIHTGHVNLDAWSGGAYWTHTGPGGWYLDAVLQVTRYGDTATTEFARLSTSGHGFISSLEGGYPLSLPQLGPGFVIEPQAQLLWQRVAFSQGNDGLGEVGLDKTIGTSGRLGLRAKWTIVTAGDQVWQPYLRANLWEDFGAQARTTFSGTDVAELLARGKRLELGGGLTARLNPNLSLYANADYEFELGHTDGGKRQSVRGAVGLKYSW
jgi:fibronectin-binding autotransporter adhesin